MREIPGLTAYRSGADVRRHERRYGRNDKARDLFVARVPAVGAPQN